MSFAGESSAGLSVIIVTFNSADCIGDCLRSVLSQGGPGTPIEIIVVDNASTDGTSAAILARFPDVRLIQNAGNAGFAAAANQGFAASHNPLVVFLNPDTVAGEGAFAGMANAAATDRHIGVVGCELVDARGIRQASCWREPSIMTALSESFLPHALSLPLVTQRRRNAGDVDMVSGACMMVRRTLFEQMGGFDQRFFMFYEDADFCLRARRGANRILYLPGARVRHTVSGSFGDDRGSFFLHVYRSKLLFFRKHHPGPRAAVVRVILIAGIALRIPAYAIAGRIFASEELLRLSKYHTFVLPEIMKV